MGQSNLPARFDADFQAFLQLARSRLYSSDREGRAVDIPWDFVDFCLAGRASGFAIAQVLGIHEDTLYNACKVDHGKEFRQYKAEKRSVGELMLSLAQFKKALDGSDIMQIWLGKQWLKQREKPEDKQLEGGQGGYAILEIADNGRSVKEQNPLNKPEDAADPEEELDVSELE